MRLVLFDIDGTLLDSGGAGARALNLAFREVFAVEDAMNGISMAGKTDVMIIKEGLERLGVGDSDGAIPGLLGSYLRNLSEEIRRSGTDGLPPKSLMPGASDLLDYLLSSRGLRLGLLTGNVREGAWIKLGAFGIHRYFSFGAFGSDSEDRNELLPLAVRMFRDISGTYVALGDCAVVGDTPLDVACAKLHGALSVAVATGPYTVEELEAAGADSVFERLPDGDTFLRLLSLA
jgi:phosphoglycolate phosphatase